MPKDPNKKRIQKAKKRKKAKAAKQKKRGQQALLKALTFQERAQRAFGSCAFCWRKGFRYLFFDQAPDLSEELDFSGMDLHLQWYPSQEERRIKENGETITSLRIDSSREVHRDGSIAGRKMFLRCKASMAQHVPVGSFYGDWHREIARNTAEQELSEETEWHELQFEFVLHLVRFKKKETAAANKLRAPDSIPYSEDCWNVSHIEFGQDITMKSNPLDADRAYELVSMLRIWTPILSSKDYSCTGRYELQEALKRIEREEQQLHDALVVQSAKTKGLMEAAHSCSDAEEKQMLKQAVDQMHVEFEAADAHTRAFLKWQRLIDLLSRFSD